MEKKTGKNRLDLRELRPGRVKYLFPFDMSRLGHDSLQTANIDQRKTAEDPRDSPFTLLHTKKSKKDPSD